MPRWTFGNEPLGQTGEAADLLRRVTSLVVALEGDEHAVDRLIADLRRAEDELAVRVPPDPTPRVGAAAGTNPG